VLQQHSMELINETRLKLILYFPHLQGTAWSVDFSSLRFNALSMIYIILFLRFICLKKILKLHNLDRYQSNYTSKLKSQVLRLSQLNSLSNVNYFFLNTLYFCCI